MSIFDFLPFALRSRSTDSFDGDPIAKIYADFGLGATAQDPFRKFSDSLIDGLLSDPFDLSISPSFGLVNDTFYSVSASPLSFENQDCLDDDLASSDGRLATGRARARNSHVAKRGNVFEANWTKKFLCDEIRTRTYFFV